MGLGEGPNARGYEDIYRAFDSPLMRRIRREAYGEDIGQHSWVSAEEMRADIHRLALSPPSQLIDFGCGPCGPLTFVLTQVGCRGTGVDGSPSALRVGRERAESLGVGPWLSAQQADLNGTLPFAAGAFDAAMSLDVVLHLKDRAEFFREVARVLAKGARFLLTDAGVVTGILSEEEARNRSAQGDPHFAPPGWNETLLASAGFRLLETENRSESVTRNAGGRLAAMKSHRDELLEILGEPAFLSQISYLETVVELSRRGALSRLMYLAEVTGSAPE